MFQHVIVGVDGRPSGRDAVSLARLLAAPNERLALAHVHQLSPVHAASIPVGEAEREGSLLLLEQERDATALDADLLTVAASSVGRGLHYLAETHDADLLTVGSCDRGFAGRVVVGNDTRASLSGSPCAVAIAPHGYAQAPHSIATIGVGYDGSAESQAALALARELAARHDATVRVLQVVQIPALAYAGFVGVVWGDAFEMMLADAQKQIDALEGVDGEAVLGLAGEELAAFGTQVDLLIVGSRGYGPARRLILGSTSEHLANHARCPLLVLPRQAVNGPDPQVSSGQHRSTAPASA
jgi:nucleotide-binding universal stress UspA family protein